jgi:hypothetical protein
MEFNLTTQQQALVDQARAIREEAVGIEVFDDQSRDSAVSFLGKIATAKKALESQRQFFVKPLNDEVKVINEKFKEFTQPVLDADMIARNKVAAYMVEQKKLAAEAQRKALEEARQKTAETGEVVAVVLPQEPDRIVRTAEGKASTRMVWDFKVVDPAKVPEQYKMIDECKIRAAVASGLRTIDGVEIFQKAELTVTGR